MANKHKALSALCVAVALLIVASAALAANQVKGGSYKGSLTPARDGALISFKVSSSAAMRLMWPSGYSRIPAKPARSVRSAAAR